MNKKGKAVRIKHRKKKNRRKVLRIITQENRAQNTEIELVARMSARKRINFGGFLLDTGLSLCIPVQSKYENCAYTVTIFVTETILSRFKKAAIGTTWQDSFFTVAKID